MTAEPQPLRRRPEDIAAEWGLPSSGRTALWEEGRLRDAQVLADLHLPEEHSSTRLPVRLQELSFRADDSPVTWSSPSGRGSTPGGQDSHRAFTRIFHPAKTSKEADRETGGPAVAVKDMISVRGEPRGAGTRAYREAPRKQNAPVVDRVLRSGASITGLVTLHALAYGATGLSSEQGAAVNALDPSVIPGGSSSGSAVAVGAGLADWSIGTDTGASIRVPAALNGVTGFKPTYGAVPAEGVLPLAQSLDHVGPLTSTPQQCAWAHAVLSGGRRLRVDGAEELLIGVPDSSLLTELDEGARDSWQRWRRELEAVPGVRVASLRLSGTRSVAAAQLAIIAREALANHMELLRGKAEELPEDVRLRLELGMFVSEGQYRTALAFQRWWGEEVENAFTRCHVMALPTTAVREPRIGEHTVRLSSGQFPLQAALTRLTAPFNLSGHPAVTVPLPEKDSPIPFGLQLVGPHHCDSELLAVADALWTQLR